MALNAFVDSFWHICYTGSSIREWPRSAATASQTSHYNSHALHDRRHEVFIIPQTQLNSLSDSNFITKQLLKIPTDRYFTPRV